MADSQPTPIPYTLYYQNQSICSLMIRYTLILRGPPKDPNSQISVEEKLIDIFAHEQLEKWFLCDINPKGQVPVLASPSLAKTIPDSVAITFHLASLFPNLIPSSHAADTTRLIKELHSLNYFSLSFPNRPHVAQGFKETVLKLLGKEGISERYRRALEYKLTVVQGEKIEGLKSEEVAVQVEKALKMMLEFEKYVPSSVGDKSNCTANEAANEVQATGPWLFGLGNPTALDAHLTVFLWRMRDVGRDELIPERLGRYVDMATETKEFKDLMQGRKTMIGK